MLTMSWTGNVRLRMLVAALAMVAWMGMTGARAQTDIAASVYGAFSGSTSSNGTTQSPANAAGVLVELRHIANPLLGLEVTYAFNRSNQTYRQITCAGTSCPPGLQYVPSNAHEVTADYLVSFKVLNLRPFVLAGGGVLFDQPTNPDATTQNSTQGVLVYGAGLDFTVLPHIGVRGQYRGNVYKAPQLAKAFSSTNGFATTSEPMLGVFLRF